MRQVIMKSLNSLKDQRLPALTLPLRQNKQTGLFMPIVEEYGPDAGKKVIKDTRAYVLQAGSFRSGNDADKLRAELILLGLDVFLQVVQKDGQTWHRVMVGPIDNELELTRKRNLLAAAAIETISLRVNL
jgi:cell division protein FtsN